MIIIIHIHSLVSAYNSYNEIWIYLLPVIQSKLHIATATTNPSLLLWHTASTSSLVIIIIVKKIIIFIISNQIEDWADDDLLANETDLFIALCGSFDKCVFGCHLYSEILYFTSFYNQKSQYHDRKSRWPRSKEVCQKLKFLQTTFHTQKSKL